MTNTNNTAMRQTLDKIRAFLTAQSGCPIEDVSRGCSPRGRDLIVAEVLEPHVGPVVAWAGQIGMVVDSVDRCDDEYETPSDPAACTRAFVRIILPDTISA